MAIITRYFERAGIKQQINGEPAFIEKQVAGLLADGWAEVADLTPTPEAVQASLTFAVQRFLDSKANERGYDNIRSAALRSAYAGPFRNEGAAYATWMDNCWLKCYEILDAVKAGTRSIPTEAELLAELPALVLP